MQSKLIRMNTQRCVLSMVGCVTSHMRGLHAYKNIATWCHLFFISFLFQQHSQQLNSCGAPLSNKRLNGRPHLQETSRRYHLMTTDNPSSSTIVATTLTENETPYVVCNNLVLSTTHQRLDPGGLCIPKTPCHDLSNS